MNLNFRQRLLTTTFIVGVSALVTPAFAQTAPAPANPSDTAGAANTQPQTTAPQEAAPVPPTNAQGAPVKSSQDIVITGTRIPQPNLTSASPVTVLTSQDIKLQGTTRTEDLINSLPQAFASMGSNVSNGATGTATVNLRGLGDRRTLVLVNGRRLQPGDPGLGSIADINFIPSSLIKRVDVLTGGASSVYGADAVAGVVNFIMDTNFNGLRIDAQGSFYMHDNRGENGEVIRAMSDPLMLGFAGFTQPFNYPKGLSTNGGAQDISAAFGTNFADGRGHIMAYATYRHQDAVLESSRDYSFCALGATAPQYIANNPKYGNFYCGGSGTNALGRFRALNPVTGQGRLSYTLGGPNGNQFIRGFQLFNFAPYNFFQRPDERYTFGTFAEYEIAPGAKPYLEAMFMHDHSDAQIAPGGDFGNTLTINCDNPLMSAQEKSLVCFPANEFVNPNNGDTFANLQINRRNVEGGNRIADLEHNAFRIVAGMKGDLLRGLSYDAYYQFGTTRLTSSALNDFSVTKLNRALDVVTDPNTGLPVCRAALTGVDPNCVPYNVFQIGGVTQAAVNYLATPGLSSGNVEETIADANFTLEGGEYGLQSPWSDRGIGLNVGGEYRKEALQTQADITLQTGDLAGSGGPTLPVKGQFDVRELFTEVQVPIISHSFIEDFTLTGGYRYSDYKVAGNHFSTNTYKIAAELAPVRDVRLRASYNRAVRAPNVVELFATQSLGLAAGADPCAGPTPVYTQAQCANTGVTAAQYGLVDANPANQYNATFGGNPNLKPEKADTYTAGVVLQPRWVPGLAFTVDYFNIKIKDLIGTLTFNNVVNQCAITGNPQFCSLIKRDQFGSLTDLPTGFVTLTNQNIGGLQTRGFDLNGSYSHRFGGLGTLNITYVATILRNLKIDTGINTLATGGTDGVYDCAGFYGATCGTPDPKYRHKLRVGFTLPNGLGISGQWRYFAKVRNDTLSTDADLNGGGGPNTSAGDARLAAQSYFDLALTARVGDRYNFRLGANNIFDKSPPVAGGDVVGPPFGNGNTFPQVYDALGRFVFAGVTVDF